MTEQSSQRPPSFQTRATSLRVPRASLTSDQLALHLQWLFYYSKSSKRIQIRISQKKRCKVESGSGTHTELLGSISCGALDGGCYLLLALVCDNTEYCQLGTSPEPLESRVLIDRILRGRTLATSRSWRLGLISLLVLEKFAQVWHIPKTPSWITLLDCPVAKVARQTKTLLSDRTSQGP